MAMHEYLAHLSSASQAPRQPRTRAPSHGEQGQHAAPCLVPQETLLDVARNERERWDLQQVAKTIRLIADDARTPAAEVFRMWDADNDGYLGYDEFVDSYLEFQTRCNPSKLGYVYEEQDVHEIARALDTRKVGRINYLAFAAMFSDSGADYASLDVDDVVVQHICTTIWANDVVLTKAFRCFDATG